MSKGATAQELFIICNQDDTEVVIKQLQELLDQQ